MYIYIYAMDVWSSLEGFTASIIKRSAIVCMPQSHKLSVNSTTLGMNICYGKGVWVHSYANPQQQKVPKHLVYVWLGYVIQFESFYSLNHIA